ncbi:MAG: histidine phosphatase family protein [Chloroflexi bacterium]|nr:histidine phosphatase family protein [Chloroflexota bacterium]
MLRLILVRHGETEWNRSERVQGSSDVELNERGRAQAEAVARALQSKAVAGVYSSPLKRALQTGRCVAMTCGRPCEIEPGLVELNEGDLEGLTYDEMRSRYVDFMAQWRRDASSVRLPGGEGLQDLQQRSWDCIARIAARHPDGDVVIVSHNFAITAIICKAIGLPLSHFRRLHLGVGSISVLALSDGRWVLESLNDTCHLIAD